MGSARCASTQNVCKDHIGLLVEPKGLEYLWWLACRYNAPQGATYDCRYPLFLVHVIGACRCALVFPVLRCFHERSISDEYSTKQLERGTQSATGLLVAGHFTNRTFQYPFSMLRSWISKIQRDEGSLRSLESGMLNCDMCCRRSLNTDHEKQLLSQWPHLIADNG